MAEAISLERVYGELRRIEEQMVTKKDFDSMLEKLNQIGTEQFMRKLGQYKGAAKTKVSDEQFHQIKEEVAMKYAQEMGIGLN